MLFNCWEIDNAPCNIIHNILVKFLNQDFCLIHFRRIEIMFFFHYDLLFSLSHVFLFAFYYICLLSFWLILSFCILILFSPFYC
jgi:hypothetical protein